MTDNLQQQPNSLTLLGEEKGWKDDDQLHSISSEQPKSASVSLPAQSLGRLQV